MKVHSSDLKRLADRTRIAFTLPQYLHAALTAADIVHDVEGREYT
jgi:hypothetical protein